MSPSDAHQSACIVGLITALVRGLLEAPPWEDFLSRLRSLASADYASLVLSRGGARYRDLHIISSGSKAYIPDPTDEDVIRRLNLRYATLRPMCRSICTTSSIRAIPYSTTTAAISNGDGSDGPW